MSKRSRCGGVRNFKLAGEPYAGIVRVEALSLWRRANFQRGRRTLCGDRACRNAVAVAPCEFSPSCGEALRTENFCLETTTLSLFWARGSAGAWGVLRNPSAYTAHTHNSNIPRQIGRLHRAHTQQ